MIPRLRTCDDGAREEDGVIDGVEGCCEVEEDENAEVSGVCREEKVVGDFKEVCFGAVSGCEAGLKWFEQFIRGKEWFTVYEHNRRPSCTVSDLVMGNEYSFRVFSENICGLSDEAGISKNTAVITKTGLTCNRAPYKEKDKNSCPKFTAPLVDRSVIAGYAAAISCAVRGYPKPKIIWMKNNMIIGEDPKFLMQNNQGVLTLNIRKPSLFDGGRYSCRAVNDLGQDEVECKVVVRVLQEKAEEAKK
ncbi:myosin-binding protein C, fast-type-like [Stegastes partitus]|uniref:Myosin-binding protein C, fast-type-like n=1 Tax=Stegastes partitus TaxID=144197 RepID=A0A9Y4NG44_9TELE|nr:PREDICTED: myosin-binding protein C, fast-type-like [Stegastes partitus]